MVTKLAYGVAFQIGWFVCVATNNFLSFIYTLLFSAIYLSLAKQPKDSLYKEFLWIVLVTSLGFILETISFSAGFLYSSAPTKFYVITFPPLWLVNLWILFAIALRTCLTFVFEKPLLTYLVSSIAIPINYYAGAALNDDVAVNDPYLISLGLISVLWVSLLWLLNSVKRYYFEDIFNAR